MGQWNFNVDGTRVRGSEVACWVRCTRVCSVAVLVRSGIGAVEIHVLVSHEATVTVLRTNVLCGDGI